MKMCIYPDLRKHKYYVLCKKRSYIWCNIWHVMLSFQDNGLAIILQSSYISTHRPPSTSFTVWGSYSVQQGALLCFSATSEAQSRSSTRGAFDYRAAKWRMRTRSCKSNNNTSRLRSSFSIALLCRCEARSRRVQSVICDRSDPLIQRRHDRSRISAEEVALFMVLVIWATR